CETPLHLRRIAAISTKDPHVQKTAKRSAKIRTDSDRQRKSERIHQTVAVYAHEIANAVFEGNFGGYCVRTTNVPALARRCRFRQDGGGGDQLIQRRGKRLSRGANGSDGNFGGTTFCVDENVARR